MLTWARPWAQDPRTWDYFEDNRASNDTWVSVDLNAGFTSVMAGMNQARALCCCSCAVAARLDITDAC